MPLDNRFSHCPAMDTIELNLDECGDGEIAFNLTRVVSDEHALVATVHIDLDLLVLAHDTKAFLDREFAPFWEVFDQKMTERAA